MKKDTHPKYYSDAVVTCACGNSFTTGSTVKELHVEICAACHPFFTGKQKVLAAAGRVDRFKKRATKTSTTTAKKIKAKAEVVKADN